MTLRDLCSTRVLCATVIASLCLSLLAPAQQSEANQVWGRLVDGHTGSPIPHVEVELIDETWRQSHKPWRCYGSMNRPYVSGMRTPGVEPSIVQTTHTDDSGCFKFQGDIPGDFRFHIRTPFDWQIPFGPAYGDHSMLTESGNTFHAYIRTRDYFRARMIDRETGEPLGEQDFIIRESRERKETLRTDSEGWLLSACQYGSNIGISSLNSPDAEIDPYRLPDAGVPFVSTSHIRERVRIETNSGRPIERACYTRVTLFGELLETTLEWLEAEVVDGGRAILLKPEIARLGCGITSVNWTKEIRIRANGGQFVGSSSVPLCGRPVRLIEHRPIDVVVVDPSGAIVEHSQVGWFNGLDQVWKDTDADGRFRLWTPAKTVDVFGFAPGHGSARQHVEFGDAKQAFAVLHLAPEELGELQVEIRSQCSPPTDVRSDLIAASVRLEPIRPDAAILRERALWNGQVAEAVFADLPHGAYLVSTSSGGSFLMDKPAMLVDVPGPAAVFVRQDEVPVSYWTVELQVPSETTTEFLFTYSQTLKDLPPPRPLPLRYGLSCGLINAYRSGSVVSSNLRDDAVFDYEIALARPRTGWKLQKTRGTSKDFKRELGFRDALKRTLRVQVVPDE